MSLNFRRLYIPLLCMAINVAGAFAALPAKSEADVKEASSLLESLSQISTSKADRVAAAAEGLIGKGFDSYYNNDSTATLRLNMEEFTPLNFINTTLALAETASGTNPSEQEFENTLVKLSCRKGENSGFPSIMWHSSDWIIDNLYRGNISELTENVDGARSKTKSLDFMSRNPENFAAMKDSLTADKIKMIEFGFRNHRIPILPKSHISKKDVTEDLRNGDIIVMIANQDGEDIYRIGIVKIEADGAHLIYVDPEQGKVVKSPDVLKRYFNLVTKYFSGFRWLRLK